MTTRHNKQQRPRALANRSVREHFTGLTDVISVLTQRTTARANRPHSPSTGRASTYPGKNPPPRHPDFSRTTTQFLRLLPSTQRLTSSRPDSDTKNRLTYVTHQSRPSNRQYSHCERSRTNPSRSRKSLTGETNQSNVQSKTRSSTFHRPRTTLLNRGNSLNRKQSPN